MKNIHKTSAVLTAPSKSRSFKTAFYLFFLLCGVAMADPLTPNQLQNADTQSDVNVNIWVIKGSSRDIQALQAIVDQEITTLRLKGVTVPNVNWSDLSQIGSVNWTKYGYGS